MSDDKRKDALPTSTAEEPEAKKAQTESSLEKHLLTRIGGPPALEAAVEIFYEKLVADETLSKFFEGVDLLKLKNHQRKFLTIALTEIPKDLDVAGMMKDKHKRLFAMGLNETHFDTVAGHLVATLKGLQVPDALVDEVVGVVAPLRPVFENGKKEYLLARIGGPAALEAAVDIFYEKLVADETLAKFFEGVDLAILKNHQRKFLTIAFTEIPKDLDVAGMMKDKHKRLFAMGLNETHFDSVAGHLVATLKGLQVADALVDEVVAVVAPLRPVFENGKKEHLLARIGGPTALEAAVDIFYEKIIADETLVKFFKNVDMKKLKKHQRDFLTLALTEVPEGVDVPYLIGTKHKRLFAEGLNETHFDSVAGHLVSTLEGLQVRKDYIDEIVAIVGPLRGVFEEGAKKAAA
jgi:hemoglobin